MRILGGDLPKGEYTLMYRQLSRGFKKRDINNVSVSGVTVASTQSTRKWHHGVDLIGSGTILAGPVGALIGLALASGKTNEVVFQIEFSNGDVAVGVGTAGEFEKLLGWSATPPK